MLNALTKLWGRWGLISNRRTRQAIESAENRAKEYAARAEHLAACNRELQLDVASAEQEAQRAREYAMSLVPEELVSRLSAAHVEGEDPVVYLAPTKVRAVFQSTGPAHLEYLQEHQARLYEFTVQLAVRGDVPVLVSVDRAFEELKPVLIGKLAKELNQ